MSERTTINIDMIEQSEHAESLKSDAARSIKTELSESVLNGINSGCESLIKHANDIQNECERYSDDSQLQLEASTFLCSMAIQMREVRKYITDLEKIIISEFDIKLFNVDIVLDLIAIVRSQCKNLLRWAENGSYQTDDLQSIRRMRKIYVCAQDEIRRFVKSLNSFLCIKV